MKVAFVTNLCAHYRYKLFRLLSTEYGFDFYFFDNKKQTKEDVKHLTMFKDDKFLESSALGILRRLRQTRYDVIIKCTNNKWVFLGCFIIAKVIKAKLVVWHTVWYYPDTIQYKFFLSRLLMVILNNYTDAIVVYGEHGKKFLTDKGVKKEKIFIAWQTVDNDLFGREVSHNEIDSITNKLKLQKDKKIILYVGRLIRLKGIEILLKSLRCLKDSKKAFTMLFCGDGDMRKEITEYCIKENIEYRITGLIPYHELPVYYKIARVLVLPSITTKTLKEAWGLVVNEAFNQGCPAIVTDAVGAGVGGLIKDGENGYLIPEGNVKELTNALNSILEDDAIYQKMCLNALEEIKEWNYERQVKGFLDAIEYSSAEKRVKSER